MSYSWPCFVLVVRNESLINRTGCIQSIQTAILKSVDAVQKLDNLSQIIAERYQLLEEDVTKWLSLTKWAESDTIKKQSITKVINTLYELKIINTPIEANDICAENARLL